VSALETQPGRALEQRFVTSAGLEQVTARFVPLVVLLCGFLFVAALVANGRAGLWGYDFEGTLWRAGRDIMLGAWPYPPPDPALLLRLGNPAVYPAPMLLAALPLSLLPLALATALWNALNIGALVGALRLVGLRDPKCYALVLLSFPLASSLVLGQLDGVLALGCALAWRYRDRAWAVLAVAAVVAAKLILWPLFIWLAVVRGLRWGFASAAVALAAVVGGWALLGFHGVLEYPRLLGALAVAFQDRGHSLVAAALHVGVPLEVARVLPWLVGGTLLVLVRRLARSEEGERRSFAAAIGAGVLFSPVVWMHYFLLLLLALAIARPRLGLAWLLVPALWISATEPAADAWRLLAGLGCALLILATGMTRPRAAQSQGEPVLT
jgi:alpha-1,2-mannosyltransferase